MTDNELEALAREIADCPGGACANELCAKIRSKARAVIKRVAAESRRGMYRIQQEYTDRWDVYAWFPKTSPNWPGTDPRWQAVASFGSRAEAEAAIENALVPR